MCNQRVQGSGPSPQDSSKLRVEVLYEALDLTQVWDTQGISRNEYV